MARLSDDEVKALEAKHGPLLVIHITDGADDLYRQGSRALLPAGGRTEGIHERHASDTTTSRRGSWGT